MQERYIPPEDASNKCLVDFMAGLYGREIDSLSEQERKQLEDSFFEKRDLDTVFLCTADNCRTTHALMLIDGKLEAGNIIMHLDSWPCMYDPEV